MPTHEFPYGMAVKRRRFFFGGANIHKCALRCIKHVGVALHDVCRQGIARQGCTRRDGKARHEDEMRQDTIRHGKTTHDKTTHDKTNRAMEDETR